MEPSLEITSRGNEGVIASQAVMERALVGIGDLATQARDAEREKDEARLAVEEAVPVEMEDEV